MPFKYFQSKESLSGIDLINQVLDIIGIDHSDDLFQVFLNDFKSNQYIIGDYTPTRLKISLDEYYESGDSSVLKRELLGRFLYDSTACGKQYCSDYPPLIHIELSSVCNYKCPFCYQSGDHYTSCGFMDLDLFKKIIDQIDNKVPYITFSVRGEPTMHPNFIEAMKYLQGKNFLDIKLNTNGSLLNEDKINAILDVCHTLVFSIDSLDPKVYPTFRIGGDFDTVFNNIDTVNRLRDKHPRKNKIKTRISGVFCDGEIQSGDNFDEDAHPLCDEVSRIDYYEWKDVYVLEKHSNTKSCIEPFHRTFIYCDGTPAICDIDYNNNMGKDIPKISDYFTVLDAWKYLEKFRKIHSDGNRQCLVPCDRCPR